MIHHKIHLELKNKKKVNHIPVEGVYPSCKKYLPELHLNPHSCCLSPCLLRDTSLTKTILVFFIQMFIFHNVTITVPENFTQCTTHGSFDQHWQETIYNMFTFVCLFLLPLIIMIFCYTRILIEISSRMARSNRKSRVVLKICGQIILSDAQCVARDKDSVFFSSSGV